MAGERQREEVGAPLGRTSSSPRPRGPGQRQATTRRFNAARREGRSITLEQAVSLAPGEAATHR